MVLKPEVQPEALSQPMRDAAEDIASVARCLGHVRVESFVHEAYATYRASLPLMISGEPEALIRAGWVRGSYYPLMQRYLESVFLLLIYQTT